MTDGNFTFIAQPPRAGYWEICGDLQIHVLKRPNWFHQKMAALLLGWQWHDESE